MGDRVRVRLRYSCSLTVKFALMGSSVETVVTALARRTHQISHLRGRGARDAVDRRDQFREAEIHVRGFDRCLRRRSPRLSQLRSAPCASRPGPSRRPPALFATCCSVGVVQVLLRNRLLLRQRNVALLVELRLALIRLGARELRLRLEQSGIGLQQAAPWPAPTAPGLDPQRLAAAADRFRTATALCARTILRRNSA